MIGAIAGSEMLWILIMLVVLIGGLLLGGALLMVVFAKALAHFQKQNATATQRLKE